jgi:hypothetical protein
LGNFDRKRFTQVMISRILRKKLEVLKPKVRQRLSMTFVPSCGQVIEYLIDNFERLTRDIDSNVEVSSRLPIVMLEVPIAREVESQITAEVIHN